MKVESDAQALLDRIERGTREAVSDVRADAERAAPRRSGRYAASLEERVSVDGDRIEGAVGSPLPYAGAVERGADVGPRRGPHMEGSHTLRDAGDRFPEHMTRRLREQG